eukprot:52409-Pelagomonas_calceolata.AAC.1
MLWLTKAYALPASMYAYQIWGARFMKEGAEMDCSLQTVHLCFLKRILGVKRTTPNWSGLRECGHDPLQFYWFRAAVRFYNALLRSASNSRDHNTGFITFQPYPTFLSYATHCRVES